MRMGGVARYVYEVETPAEVADAAFFAESLRIPLFILGGGANTIGRDEGFRGVILINRMKGINFSENADGTVTVKAMGGEVWDDVVEATVMRGLTGAVENSGFGGRGAGSKYRRIWTRRCGDI